jgi:hypothetical protein
MKRGLITWDRSALAPDVLKARVRHVQKTLGAQSLPALVVYSDVWRSNGARYLSNFMPFWGRSLLVVPASGEPLLVCGLSARVYPWIRTVTPLQDIRPASQLGPRLLQVAAERGWRTLGVLDLPRLPHDVFQSLASADLETIDVPCAVLEPWTDATELAMRRSAAQRTREIVEAYLDQASPRGDRELVAELERRCRSAGGEDFIAWISQGGEVPRPASGRSLGPRWSVTVACEHLGLWVMVSRIKQPGRSIADDRESYARILKAWPSASVAKVVYDLGRTDSFVPYRPGLPLATNSLAAILVGDEGGGQLYYGDTCVVLSPGSAELL